MDLSLFINPLALLFVCFPIGTAMILLGFESAIDRVILMRDMGIPIGVLGSLIGTQHMVFGIDAGAWEADHIYSGTAVMFTTMLYGGVISGLGFFLSGSGRGAATKIKNRHYFIKNKYLCK